MVVFKEGSSVMTHTTSQHIFVGSA